ncbi:hypothetical protein VTJ49DRAFT_5485 [Mycothermus thermophilus]|uniref:cAMP-independent regulatory protein pac2 n=1 Tax=Humicola insolens TaxID=85995 RepID=A0ABR3V2Z8_HUMIN
MTQTRRGPTMDEARRAPLMMETYYGAVRSPADAIKLFEACRLGLLPRVQRRLSEKERQAIRSGSVFVWDEREAGMRRWTDGKSWSASRVSGSFLTYREMEGKRGNAFGGSRRGAGKTPDSGRGSDEDQDDGEPDGYRYKPDGLTKQSFSITNSAGQHLHLIAYYARGPLDLIQPTNDPALRHIIPAKGMYPESSLAETSSRAPLHQPHYSHHAPPHHGYPPPYPHPSYGWPPSPVSTPPYAHGHHYPYPPGPPPPHAYHHYPPHPPHHFSHPPAYERAALPPPPPPPQSAHPQLPAPLPPKTLSQPYPQNQHQSPPLPPPRLSVMDSPRSQQLQPQAREAVQVEPRLAPIEATHSSHRSPRSSPRQQPAQYHQPPSLPVPNGSTGPVSPTASPPRSAISPTTTTTDAHGSRTESQSSTTAPTPASTRPSLSALLLHPPPTAGSEPSSANPTSAGTVATGGLGSSLGSGGSSPGGGGPGSQGALAVAAAAVARVGGEDARAIGALNKNFF